MSTNTTKRTPNTKWNPIYDNLILVAYDEVGIDYEEIMDMVGDRIPNANAGRIRQRIEKLVYGDVKAWKIYARFLMENKFGDYVEREMKRLTEREEAAKAEKEKGTRKRNRSKYNMKYKDNYVFEDMDVNPKPAKRARQDQLVPIPALVDVPQMETTHNTVPVPQYSLPKYPTHPLPAVLPPYAPPPPTSYQPYPATWNQQTVLPYPAPDMNWNQPDFVPGFSPATGPPKLDESPIPAYIHGHYDSFQ